MIKDDLISVVVPAYNHEKYIEECINSIINQTYENIELIILNDGSNDGTAEKIKSKSDHCKSRFKRFLFIDKENEGIAKTLNKGCFKSKGKFLAVCASDDSYTNDAIETMYDFLRNNSEYVLAVGNNYFMDDKSKRCFWNSKGETTYDLDTNTTSDSGGDENDSSSGLTEAQALSYIASNPDLINAFGTDTDAAIAHYTSNGQAEGRSIDAFNATNYLANYSDLAAAFGSDTAAATRHYITCGYAEGRNVELFSFSSYLQRARMDVDFYSEEFGTYKSLLKGNYIPNGYLIRKDIFINKVKGYTEKPALDDYFLHLQLSKFGKYKYIDKHLFNYRWHESNTIKQKDKMTQLNIYTLALEKEYAYKFGFKKLFNEYMKKNIYKKIIGLKNYFYLKKVYKKIRNLI